MFEMLVISFVRIKEELKWGIQLQQIKQIDYVYNMVDISSSELD